jgi:hypothetical protein
MGLPGRLGYESKCPNAAMLKREYIVGLRLAFLLTIPSALFHITLRTLEDDFHSIWLRFSHLEGGLQP